MNDANAQDHPQQYLTFQLGGERFACDIMIVKEILQYGRLTSVPQMPAFVHGVMNLRGSIVPIIDLAQRFGRPPFRPGRRSCIVIMEVNWDENQRHAGILADCVQEIIALHPPQMSPPPPFGSHLRTDFIAGMVHHDADFLTLLDIPSVLSIDELNQLSCQMHYPMRTETAAPMS